MAEPRRRDTPPRAHRPAESRSAWRPRRSTAPRGRPEPPRLRGRVWVEVGGGSALSEAGADLLEQILACGSLSRAARRLGFSYRRAWVLVDAMNRRWPNPLVAKAVGGARGGGSSVTALGRAVLAAYRALQIEVEALLDRQAVAFRAQLRAALV
ncbi:MAG: winged helix-turn-helix domain-containing protein [Phycisphaerae bacterium]